MAKSTAIGTMLCPWPETRPGVLVLPSQRLLGSAGTGRAEGRNRTHLLLEGAAEDRETLGSADPKDLMAVGLIEHCRVIQRSHTAGETNQLFCDDYGQRHCGAVRACCNCNVNGVRTGGGRARSA